VKMRVADYIAAYVTKLGVKSVFLLSGGGMRMGQVVGSTNHKGEEPRDRPVTPTDFLATLYRFLGVDWKAHFPDHSGRPIPILPHGQPIHELIEV